MRISFIGAGRVAHHLAVVLSQNHQIVQIYSRSLEHAQTLAAQISARATTNIAELEPDVDLVIIAVSDQAIAEVIQQAHAQLADVLIVHTSGSTDIQVLAGVHTRAGVFYPLQTFSLEREVDWQATPLFVEATQPHDLERLTQLANSLSSRVYAYTSAQRLSLHLAAVFACNFSNYCYDMAKQIVDAKQVDFSLLYPLILETAHKAVQHDPKQVQTGPAMRGDQNILNMHQQMLDDVDREDLKNVYNLMSQQILQSHQAKA
ncbi:F420-dependent NADP oxidoreductase [Acinetobacter sp. ANC 3903]|uniref:Rossmann-like and DUF2520 domain-containing protein n=1 Tax=Acinetobacter sp. ANC 3903 TaxID=1977883 RepID=UPI000A334D56|nr:Rossmann-like and DUF2520 domain-containing protein [Acinetobacter sp. ANC 3903]OTG59140.1 F420-dependent NADP oxidoreductase [Acinetobacter sp. ANC 3903]